MKNICHQNVKRRVNSLFPIVELYIDLTADVEKISKQLNVLPAELEILQHQADLLNLKSAQNFTKDSELQLQQTEFILDSLVDDLDRISNSFGAFEYKLNNIMALKERLEALQEERVHGLTPEKIYKLLEKERELSPAKSAPKKL